MPVAPDRTAAATDARLCSNHDPPRRADMGGRGHGDDQQEGGPPHMTGSPAASTRPSWAPGRAPSADRIASSRVRPATREGVTP